ncbi:MAG: hypothetical protein UU32_C0004G0022 [Candidatus Woesebacteria bacterium GW2011_GWB1_41_10]|uniref:Core-binding (CB) domain-containing protein n=1 Tax=Candidatus Woesebacteria bacterium GW2011_GWB1_41_10 TaxID=1618577 RepID=A0A0G0XJ25_9BACT|nr:MAG: hypothetical protein UU32_C0004G0022 [Candidatus Woesebacteria bacterium GW2011_GWB1_41_10]
MAEKLQQITPELVKKYQDETSKFLSPATAKRKNISLNRFFNWAKEAGHINKNPLIQTQPKTHKSYFISHKSFALVGMTFGIAILVFALAGKLQSPIRYVLNLAIEGIPESKIQTQPGRTSPPSPTPLPTPASTPIPAGNTEIPSGVTPTPAGELAIGGTSITIKTTDGSDGNIEINPDGFGIAHFLFEGTGENFLNAQAPNLTSGSLYYGVVANNAVGYDLLRLQSGSKPVTRLSVDSLGNTYIGGSEVVSGQLSVNGIINTGNFTVTQSPGNFASITKKGSALSDVLTLSLDERGFANSTYSALVLNRFNGAKEALALLVDEGNVRFDGQLQLGRFTSNPTSIGQGSIIFNTGDNAAYIWNGSSWVAFAGSGSNADTLDSLDSTQFLRSDTSDSFTSGTLTTDAGTTLDVNGDISIADTNISFDGASTTFTTTGDLTLTSNFLISSQGDLRLYDSDGSNYTGFQATSNLTSNLLMTLPSSVGSSGYVLTTDGGGTLSWADIGGGGGSAGAWTLSDPYLYPDSVNYQVGVGTTTGTDVISKLYVTNTGNLTGKAVAIFNQTESQDIVTASASGTPKFTVANSGNIITTGDIAINGGDITSTGSLSVTPTTTLTLNSTGDLTFDSSTDIILDADGADLIFKDAGTTIATFTNSATDLTLDIVGGNLLFADTDVINIGGLGATAYSTIADAADSPEEAAIAADNDLYVGGDVEIDGTLYAASVTATALAWDDLTAPTADLTLAMGVYNTTFNWDPGDNSAETAFSLTFDGQDTAADEDQVLLALSQIANATDSTEASDALLTFANSDANDPVENAIRFDAGGAGVDFTYGINFDAASFGTAELILVILP